MMDSGGVEETGLDTLFPPRIEEVGRPEGTRNLPSPLIEVPA